MPSIGDSLQLTRSDLAGFPEESIKYVLNLQKEKGWRGIRSNRSHLALLSPDGEHRYGLSSNPDGLLWLKRDVKRYYASKEEEENPVKTKTTKEKYVCPRDQCPKVFNSLENLDAHINVDHEGRVKCPDCSETFEDNRRLGRHRGLKHGYKSPRYELRKKQEAARAKAVDEFVKLGPDEEEPRSGVEEIEKTKELINEVTEVPSGVKFDPEILKATLVNSGSPMLDTMDVRNLVPSEAKISLKDFTPVEIREKTTALFTSNFDNVTPEDRAKLNHLDSQEVFDRQFEEPEVEDITFLDDRDSWTLDLSDIGDLTVENIIRNMSAAGLGLEIRVWKKTR